MRKIFKTSLLLLAGLILLSGCAKTENQNKDENNSVQSIEEAGSLENDDKTSSGIEDAEFTKNTDADSLNSGDDYAQIVFEGHDI